MSNISNLLYEDKARIDIWLKLLWGIGPALTFIFGIRRIFDDITGAAVLFAVTAFVVLLFRILIPQRYEIWSDRVKMVLGFSFALNIPFSTIKEARKTSIMKAFTHSGLRYATSTRGSVGIIRTKGWNVVISPSDCDMFLEQLNHAMSSRLQDENS